MLTGKLIPKAMTYQKHTSSGLIRKIFPACLYPLAMIQYPDTLMPEIKKIVIFVMLQNKRFIPHANE